MPDIDLISLTEYASLHGVTPDTVRQKILRGKLPQAVKIGRNWLIPRSAPYTDCRVRSGRYTSWRKKSPVPPHPDANE